MLDFLLFVAALFFCAGVLMWLGLLAVRAAHLAVAARQRRHRHLILGALARFRVDRDGAAMADALHRAHPAALIDIASRVLQLFTPAESQAYRAVLERRRVAAFIRRRMGRAHEAHRLLYCEMLATLGDEASIAVLRRAVSDRSAAVRVTAAIGLAATGQLLDLRAALARLGAKARRSARLAIMFEQLLPERREDVADIARDDRLEPRVRLSAFVALTGIDESAYRGFTEEMAQDRAPAIAASAARSLGDGRHPMAGTLLERLLASPSITVRRQATDAAARLGDGALMPALRLMLRDRDPIVHATAARSMSRLMLESPPFAARVAPPAQAPLGLAAQ